ncbi:MAG: sulfopyruvate decarboxylase subunit beta [SAR202 cluster bacterium]|nr:sulfopyruvate decarboxylase subunit beta [SAR202 cluster bacterium]|tara:strand:+ start:2351 stop:2932 length:582 start_codon:yes stop_codon:yes gene_type:complete
MEAKMLRFEAIKKLLRDLDDEVVVVGNLGPTSDEMWHAGDREKNYYTYGSMGLCSSIALGISLNCNNKVVAFDGDGSILMNLGSLATIGRESPANLIVVIWDNEMWGQVGRQYSHTHYRTNLEDISKGSGISRTITVENIKQLESAFSKALFSEGPWVVIAKIEEGEYMPVAPVEPEKTTYKFRESMLKNAKT